MPECTTIAFHSAAFTRYAPTTEIPVSGVQFSPCPPVLFGAYITTAFNGRSCRGSNGVSSARVRGRTDESLDRLTQVLRAQVRIPLYHHQGLVTENLDRVEIDAGHGQPTRGGVLQVVKAGVGNLGGLHHLRPRSVIPSCGPSDWNGRPECVAWPDS